MGRTASLFTRPGAGQASAQQGFDARIDLLMDVLDAAHPTIPRAVNALPAAARGDPARVLAALAQIGVVRLVDIGGGVLAVSQFTLCADTRHGRRPDFFAAARPETALPLFETVVSELKKAGVAEVQTGVFGADMQVELLNDGPVTILLDTEEWKKK